MIPHACDALLPIERRYTSDKFRQLSRVFDPARLDWDYAVELVAFMRFLGGAKYARAIMHWPYSMVAVADALMRDPRLVEASEPYYQHNLREAKVEDGFAILRAMQDAGRRKGQLPQIVKMAILEEHHATGISAEKQGLKHGLSRDQIMWVRDPRREKPNRSLVGLAFG